MSLEIKPLLPFKYVAPATLTEAIALLNEYGSGAKLLSGGTDLLPRMKRRRVSPQVLVDLNGISDLAFIRAEKDGLHIGAGTRLAALYDSPVVREKASALADAIRVMSSPGVRSRATIGGNLCNAARCADTPAPLLVLDASVKLRGADGERTVPLLQFFVAPQAGRGKTVLRDGEVMTEVVIPPQRGPSTFEKLGRRQGSSTAIICAAAYTAVANGKFEDVRVALNAFGSTPVRGSRVEARLRGEPVGAAIIASAAELIKDEIDPISDHRASAAYRKEMAAVVIRRALTRLAMGNGHAD